MTTLTHHEQRVAGIKESLIAAGIGPAYHYRTLKEYAPDMLPVMDAIIADAKQGKGVIFVGETRAYDTTILTARALHMKNISCQFIQLTRFIRWLEVDRDDIATVEQRQCLFIPRFAGSDDSPMTNWQRRLVEDFISERIDNGQAFFAQVSGTLSGSRWWSEEFVKRLSDATSVRICSESGTSATPRPH